MSDRLTCGAQITDFDVVPCLDPYCRICRDHTGEVIDKQPPRLAATREGVIAALRRWEFHYTDEHQLQAGLTEALEAAGYEPEREVRLTPRDRIDLLVDRIGIEVKVDGRAASVARQCARYLESDRIDQLILVTTRQRHNLKMDRLWVMNVAHPW